MSDIAPQSVVLIPSPGPALNATRKGVALGANAFITLATGTGALLATSLVRTAVTLMRDEPSPAPGELFEGRVRLKALDSATSGGRMMALSPLPPAQ